MKHTLLLIAILSLAGFLRLYRLYDMVGFDFDQEYAANFVYSLVNKSPIKLIGQELTIKGLYLGPIHYYYLAPFFLLYNLHPIGGYVGSVILSLFIIIGYFVLGSVFFTPRAGLLAAFVRSVLFQKIGHDWSMNPAFNCEIVILLTLYGFYKYWKGSVKIFPFLFFLFGLYGSIYPNLFTFYFAFAILVLIKGKLPPIKDFILSVIAFLAPLYWFIAFDLRNGFLQTKRLIQIFTTPSVVTQSFWERFINNLEHIITDPGRVLGLEAFPLIVTLVLFWGFILWAAIKRVGFWKDSFHAVATLVIVLSSLVVFSKIPANISENYFLTSSTLMILYLSATLSHFWDKKYSLIISFVVVTIFLSNIYLTKSLRWDNISLISLGNKERIVDEIVRRSEGDNFSVSYIAEDGWRSGFDYIFELRNKEPVPITKDGKVFTIVIPKNLVEKPVDINYGDIGIILPD